MIRNSGFPVIAETWKTHAPWPLSWLPVRGEETNIQSRFNHILIRYPRSSSLQARWSHFAFWWGQCQGELHRGLFVFQTETLDLDLLAVLINRSSDIVMGKIEDGTNCVCSQWLFWFLTTPPHHNCSHQESQKQWRKEGCQSRRTPNARQSNQAGWILNKLGIALALMVLFALVVSNVECWSRVR